VRSSRELDSAHGGPVFLTGTAIAPTMIAANSGEGWPSGTAHEAFACAARGPSGVAIGSIVSGVVIDELGTRGGQAVGVVAGGLAATVVVIGANTLQGSRKSRQMD